MLGFVSNNQINVCHVCQVAHQLEENGIEVREYNAVGSDVSLLESDLKPGETKIVGNGTYEAEENKNELVWADPGSCCYALYTKLNSDKVLLRPSPLALAKALKVTNFFYFFMILGNDFTFPLSLRPRIPVD